MAHTKIERETSVWQRKFACEHTMIVAMAAMVGSLMFWKVGPDTLVYENIHYSQLTQLFSFIQQARVFLTEQIERTKSNKSMFN